jgi:hypothetical protein
MTFRTSLERHWEPVPEWRSATPQSEPLSEPLGHPPRHQPREQAQGRLERAREPARGRLERARGRLEQRLEREQVDHVRNPFILVVDKLNRRQTHCLECIKDVALDVEEHSREYEPWD